MHGWLRAWCRRPLLVGQFALTIAIGMGTVSAVASLLLALGYQKLPFRAPSELVAVWERGDPGAQVEAISGPDFADMAAGTRNVFSTLAPFLAQQYAFTDWLGRDAVSACAISADGFQALGLSPVLGRGVAGDDTPAGSPAAAPAWISEHLWRARYGADPTVIDRVIGVGTGPSGAPAFQLRIVGVLPGTAAIPLPFATGGFDLWYILRDMSGRSRAAPALLGVGRLRPGVQPEQAQAALRAVTDRLGARYAFDRHKLPVVETFEQIAEGPARRTFGLLTLGVGLVFLIACGNTAILMVAEGVHRKRELAVRMALGASRWRLWRRVAAENGTLTAIALAAGLGFAWLLERSLTQLLPAAGLAAPMAEPPGLSAAVMIAFSIFALAAAAVWSAIMVAASGARDPARVLGGAPSGSEGDGSGRGRLLLLSTQAGIGICLFAAAVLAARTYAAASVAQLGPEPGKTIVLDVAPAAGVNLSDAQAAQFKQQLLSRLGQLPGSQAIALADRLPPSGAPATFVERNDPAATLRAATPPLAVTTGFFRAMGMPILYGRGLAGSDDRVDAERVAVVNLELAQHNWPDAQAAVGSVIELGAKADRQYRVIGVVGNFTGYWFQQPVPEMYVPEAASTYQSATVILRTSARPGAVEGFARQALLGMPGAAAISNPRTMQSAWQATLTRPLARMVGMLLLALLGLGLAVQGVAAACAAMVAARSSELAVRSALGANPRELAWSVTRQPACAVLAGGAAGAAAALVLDPILAHWLGPLAQGRLEPVAAAWGLLALVALAGCYFPARAAARTDPARLLRQG